MQIEHIIKRINGDQVKIVVSFYSEYVENNFHYKTSILYRNKGKRKWRNPTLEQEATVTPAEYKAAKLQLWDLFKPV